MRRGFSEADKAAHDESAGVPLALTKPSLNHRISATSSVVLRTEPLLQLGFRLDEQSLSAFEDDPARFNHQYGQRLREIVDARRMPALAEIVEAGVFDLDDVVRAEDLGADFDFGLHLFLEGVAAHIRGRS